MEADFEQYYAIPKPVRWDSTDVVSSRYWMNIYMYMLYNFIHVVMTVLNVQ